MKRPKFKAKVDIDCRYSNTLIYEVSVTTNGHQTMSFPQMSLDELKELNEVISKFLKDEKTSENTKQAYIEGRLKNTFKKGIGNGLIGDNNPRSKLSIKQRKKILKLYNTGNYTFSELGRMYNVTRITIRDHCVNYNFKKLKP